MTELWFEPRSVHSRTWIQTNKCFSYSLHEDRDCAFPRTWLQVGNLRAKSGPQMCFVWPTQSFLKIRKFYIIIYISGFSGEPGRSSNPESEHSDAGLLPRSSHSLFPSQTLPALTAQFSVLPQGICQFLFTEDNPHIAEWLAALALTY